MARYKVRKGFTFFGPTHVKDVDKDVHPEGEVFDISPELECVKNQSWKLESIALDKKTDTVVRVINKPTENRAVVGPPVAKTEQMRPSPEVSKSVPANVEPKKPELKKSEPKKPAGKVVRVK